MPDTYVFMGLSTTGYPHYARVDTGEMLIAEPGESYQMRAVEEGLPIPPSDGRWEAAGNGKGASVPAKPAAPAPTKPSAPEGGE